MACDRAVAAEWYRRAAEQGHPEAQAMLAFAYYYGLGVAEDREVGVAWYRKAAEQGRVDAQERLGNAYYHGEGVAQDREVGIAWLREAAEQGNEAATRLLADALADQGAAEDGTTRAIADFGESRFPCSFGGWRGIGAASQRGLEAQGITEPVQLLGRFLSLKMDAAAFEALLRDAGVASAALIRAQLQEWCQIHDVGAQAEAQRRN